MSQLCNRYVLRNILQKVNTKIVLFLSPKADSKTRQRFFDAVDQINEMLKAWMTTKAGGIGVLQNWDVQSSVVWISVLEEEHTKTCKGIAKLLLERHGVGDKYEIIVNPKSILK